MEKTLCQIKPAGRQCSGWSSSVDCQRGQKESNGPPHGKVLGRESERWVLNLEAYGSLPHWSRCHFFSVIRLKPQCQATCNAVALSYNRG